MGKVHDAIDDTLAAWIRRQHLFFVGTAPSGDEGHVNVSPKGDLATFRIVDPRRIAFLDHVGSGVETIAHLRENGRIVVMFCAFDGPPRIVRLHGRGRVTQLGPGFDALAAELGFTALVAAGTSRSIIEVDVTRVADSCGYGVPLMTFTGTRTQQAAWAEKKLRQGPGAIVDYTAAKNARSLDGLPGIEVESLPGRTESHPDVENPRAAPTRR